jgi:choline dehydrogenase
MQAIRGTPEDFDAWEAMGCSGWGADDVLPFFKRFENDLDFADDEAHGSDGPFPIQRLPASDRSKWGPVDSAFYDAVVSMGWPEVPDHNSFDR